MSESEKINRRDFLKKSGGIAAFFASLPFTFGYTFPGSNESDPLTNKIKAEFGNVEVEYAFPQNPLDNKLFIRYPDLEGSSDRDIVPFIRFHPKYLKDGDESAWSDVVGMNKLLRERASDGLTSLIITHPTASWDFELSDRMVHLKGEKYIIELDSNWENFSDYFGVQNIGNNILIYNGKGKPNYAVRSPSNSLNQSVFDYVNGLEGLKLKPIVLDIDGVGVNVFKPTDTSGKDFPHSYLLKNSVIISGFAEGSGVKGFVDSSMLYTPSTKEFHLWGQFPKGAKITEYDNSGYPKLAEMAVYDKSGSPLPEKRKLSLELMQSDKSNKQYHGGYTLKRA